MISVSKLANGITVVCQTMPGLGKAAIHIVARIGSLLEKTEEAGLTNLMQESCFGGTITKSRQEIAASVESKGGHLSSATGRSTTSFNATSLARHTETTFSALADVFLNPAFDAEEVSKSAAQVGQWIQQQDENPASRARKKFLEGAFAGQSAAHDPMGTPEKLLNFKPEQLRTKHKEMLSSPQDIVISFAGDIDPATALKMAETHFGKLPAAAEERQMPKVFFVGGDLRETTKNDQLNIIFGFEAPAKKSPDKYAAWMLEELLSGGMSSPLFQEIREKRGLVYSVGAGYTPLDTTGFFRIMAGTGKGNAQELVSASFDLLGQVIRDGFTPKEIAEARARIVRSMTDAREAASDAAGVNAAHIVDYGRVLLPEEIHEHLKQVTNDDVRRACGEMLKTGRYALANAGPQDAMPSEEDIRRMMSEQLKGIILPAPKAHKAVIPARAEADAATANLPAKISTLKNNMKVVTIERPGNLSCGAWVGAGAAQETPALNGATHMNEHMMFKGTKSYGPGEIDRIIEGDLGGALNAYTSHDRTCYYFYSLLPSALEKVVDICGEMVFMAKISQDEFDGHVADGKKNKGERDVVIEEIMRANDNVNSCKWNAFLSSAYPDQPQGRPVLGTIDTLRAMTAEKLRAYRDEYYTPGNVVFCAVGPVKHEDFVAIVEKKYGQLPDRPVAALQAPSYKGGTQTIEAESAKLCNIVIGAESVSTVKPENYAYKALGIILSDGVSSRLQQKLIFEKELTASINAGVNDYYHCGMFCIIASAVQEKVKPLISGIYDELRAVTQSLTMEEIEKAKATLEMEILSILETNQEACDRYACDVQAFGHIVTPADISAAIQKITREDVLSAAKAVLGSNPAVAMIVPKGTPKNFLPDHAEILAMRDGISPEPLKKSA